MALRTQTADLLKGIAALLMIQVHIIELFATNTISESSIGKVLLFLGGPPVAPLFIMFLGYFIAGSQKTTVQLIIRGIKIFFLGLLLNIALNLNLIISVYKGIYEIDIWPYTFGVDILPLAGLSIIFIALLKKIIDKNIILMTIITLITAFSGQFLLNYIPAEQKSQYILSFFCGASTWSYFPLFPWFSYALTGILFYKIKQKYNLDVFNSFNRSSSPDGHLRKVKLVLGLGFITFLALTIQYAISIASNLPMYYHHGLIFFLWIVTFLLFYSFFVNEINKILGTTFGFRYLKWLGKNITIVYVIQWIIIGNIATEIYKTVSSPLYLSLWFIGITVVTSAIGLLWIKIREHR